MSSNPCITGRGVKTIKRQTRVAYGWLGIGQSVVEGLAYGLAVRPLSVTWTAPLQLRHAASGAIQVLYAIALQLCIFFGMDG